MNAKNAATPKPAAVASVVHPDVAPRDAIIRSLAVLHAHQAHMLPEDVTMMNAIAKKWRITRKEVELASVPKVGETVRITRGPKALVGKEAKVLHVLKTQVVLDIAGGRVASARNVSKVVTA